MGRNIDLWTIKIQATAQVSLQEIKTRCSARDFPLDAHQAGSAPKYNWTALRDKEPKNPSPWRKTKGTRRATPSESGTTLKKPTYSAASINSSLVASGSLLPPGRVNRSRSHFQRDSVVCLFSINRNLFTHNTHRVSFNHATKVIQLWKATSFFSAISFSPLLT